MQRQGCQAPTQEHQREGRHMGDGNAGEEERSAPDQAEQGKQRPGPGAHLIAIDGASRIHGDAYPC
ncbi:hypothetical protein D3C71_1843700 [compost metagenome]